MFVFDHCEDDDGDEEETAELIRRRDDDEGLCGRKKARLTRFANDCFDVGITKFVNEDFIFDEVDFFFQD